MLQIDTDERKARMRSKAKRKPLQKISRNEEPTRKSRQEKTADKLQQQQRTTETRTAAQEKKMKKSGGKSPDSDAHQDRQPCAKGAHAGSRPAQGSPVKTETVQKKKKEKTGQRSPEPSGGENKG